MSWTSSPLKMENHEITLTTEEEELFETLLNVVSHKGLETELRVAGGWVRDKLMNNESSDIDIALSDQTGLEFATAVNEYLTEMGKETRTVAHIMANPDQSKHLETANVRVLGFEIDFVNLRAETYTDSRIPEVRIGTAEEDARRRDFSINALFYNLKTRRIEDLTGCGMEDLKKGLVRTPIPAHITFKDDPLRVLRAIRFASRFNFSLDEEIFAAGSRGEIGALLSTKVSRERIYKECDGCMSKPTSRPYLAFYWVLRLGLLDIILPVQDILAAYPVVPASLDGSLDALLDSWKSGTEAIFLWLNILLCMREDGILSPPPPPPTPSSSVCERTEFSPLAQKSTFTPLPYLGRDWTAAGTISAAAEETFTPLPYLSTDWAAAGTISAAAQSLPKYGSGVKVLFWAAAVRKLADLRVTEKKKEISLIPVLLKDGLKMENTTVKNVKTMIDSVLSFQRIVEDGSFTIEAAGAVLRECKEQWRDCVLFSCACALAAQDKRQGVSAETGSCTGTKRALNADEKMPTAAQSNPSVVNLGRPYSPTSIFIDVDMRPEELMIVAKFQRLLSLCEENSLDKIWLLKPLMNGNELTTALGIPKGPLIGKILEQQMLWQISSRQSEDKSACLAHLCSVLVSMQ